MGLSNPENDRHNQHSMVIVPLDSPGLKIKRMLKAYGDYDAPFGHGEMHLENVRVPKENLIMGMGKGFAIAQGRLGPGRIHHCMRTIGLAEKALELTIDRGMKRVAFGSPIIKLGGNAERIAQARIAIDQARLMTLYAAWKIDNVGVKNAMTEISAIKVVVPRMAQDVVDMAVHWLVLQQRDAPCVWQMAQMKFIWVWSRDLKLRSIKWINKYNINHY